MRVVFTYLILSFLYISLSQAQSKEAFDIAKNMLDNCKKVESMYFEMKKTERIDSEFITEEFRTKLQYHPFLVYSRKIEKGKTPELLFRQGKNENKALINPDGFPWFNISLDPMGEFMRKNQHHTLYETGYKYALRILEHLFDKYGDELVDMSRKLNDTIVRGIPCHQLEFVNHHFKFKKYTVKNGENIIDIAKRDLLSEFMIVEVNEDVEDYYDVEPGQVIIIPVDYCHRLKIAIDKNRMIPLSMKVFDKKGLFEQFEYSNVEVNKKFDSKEFTEEYPRYGF